MCLALVFMFLFEGFEDVNIGPKIEAISLKAMTKLASSSQACHIFLCSCHTSQSICTSGHYISRVL